MAIKVNKKKFMKQLRDAVKARKSTKAVLEGGLFAPTEHDLREELVGMPSFNSRKEISHD